MRKSLDGKELGNGILQKKDGRYDDEIDGRIGPKTLKSLISYGFKY